MLPHPPPRPTLFPYTTLFRSPALVGGRVLGLPLLALGLVALEPLVGLGVEALGVLVLAVLVVLGGHAVQGRIEGGVVTLGVHALVGLLERQRDPATLEIDVDDLHEDVLVDRDDLLGQIDVALGQLGDVHQALDAVLDAHEGAEGDQLGDLARDDLADGVGAGEQLPRVLLGRLQRQGDALAVHVHVEHLDVDLLTDLDDLGGVVDVLPGQLGDVHQAVDTAEIDEGAEVDDGGHRALADLALLQGLQEVGADRGLGLLQVGAARQDHVVAVLVELDDLRLDLLADVGLQVAHAAHLDEGGGEEAAQADVDDQAALDDLDDAAGDDALVFLDLLDRAPGALVLGALLGQDQAAFLVLLLEDQGLDLVADLDDLTGVDVVLDGQLTRGDDALGLVADVQEDLIVIDLDHGALDDVAIVEVLDGRIDGGHEVIGATDVVDGDRGGRGLGHLVRDSVGPGMSRD